LVEDCSTQESNLDSLIKRYFFYMILINHLSPITFNKHNVYFFLISLIYKAQKTDIIIIIIIINRPNNFFNLRLYIHNTGLRVR
jgi:hypothetical protein